MVYIGLMQETLEVKSHGALQSIFAVGMVGAVVFGAYRLNGELNPITDIWNQITTDANRALGDSLDQTKRQNMSIELGTAAGDCLSATGAGVVKIDVSPENSSSIVYVRQAGGAALNLLGITNCLSRAVPKDMSVRVVVINNQLSVK